MGPKRRSSSRLVVKTTKQVVKETVEVSVVQSRRQKKVNDDEQQELPESTIALETKEENKTEKVEVSVDKEPAKIIPIESQEEIAAQDKEPQETRTIPVEYAAVGTPERQEGTTPSVDEGLSTGRNDKEPSKDIPMETQEKGGENVEDKQQEEKKTDPVDKEPVGKDVSMEIQQQDSETQNYEEARETISMDTQEESETQNFEENPTTPEKKEENQPSKVEEEKSVDVKQTGGGEEKKDKKRKRRSPGKNREGEGGYKRYVYKVLKQVHPELGMSAKAMVVLNNYMHDMFERLADEAAKLTMYTARKTLSAREIQGAVKLVLPGELGKHAMGEGTKAVSNYLSKSASRSHKS